MSDNIPLDEQQACVDETATLTDHDNEMRYYLFSSVSSEDVHGKQQLQLYIYGPGSEGFVKNQKERLELIKVEKGCFLWNQPRGDMITAIVTIGEFSCTKKLETQKLTSTRYPGNMTFTLPSVPNATQIIGNVELLDQDEKLVTRNNLKFPMCPRVTRHGIEHDESSSCQNSGQIQTIS